MDFFSLDIDDELEDHQRPSTSRRQTSTNSEKIQISISDMMFANGDASNPNQECVSFMQELLKEQLFLAINRANELAKSRSENHFKLPDLLHNFWKHHNFVCRLVKYASNRLMLASFNASFESNSAEIHHHRNHSDIDKFCSAFKSFDQDGTLSQLIDQSLDPDHVDRIKQARQARILQLSERMDTLTYSAFAKARRKCLCYTHDRHVSKPFMQWISNLNLDSYSILVLNFLASEIVAQMVENALLVRECDPKFREQSANFHEIPIELAHYKSALRRNIGYHTSGNLLFGYIVVD